MSKSTIMVMAGACSFLIVVSLAIHKRADTSPKEISNQKLEAIFNNMITNKHILSITNHPTVIINDLNLYITPNNSICEILEYTVDDNHIFNTIDVDCNSVISTEEIQNVTKIIDIGDTPTINIDIRNRIDDNYYTVSISDVSKTDSFVDKYKNSFTIKKGN